MKLARANDLEVDTEACCDGEVVVEEEWCQMMVVLPAKNTISIDTPGVSIYTKSVRLIRFRLLRL